MIGFEVWESFIDCDSQLSELLEFSIPKLFHNNMSKPSAINTYFSHMDY